MILLLQHFLQSVRSHVRALWVISEMIISVKIVLTVSPSSRSRVYIVIALTFG